MTVNLADAIRFSQLMSRLQAIIRETRIVGRPGKENDVEHSYQLAMMAWYLNDAGEWGMNVDRLIRYAMVHDLAEAYAGDVHIFHPDHPGKGIAEAEALRRIAGEFPEFPGMTEIVHQYELQEDAESQTVYALDKLMPMIMIYLEGGSTWRELGFEMEKLLTNKTERIARSPQVFRLHQELSQLIRQRPELFTDATSISE